MVSMVTPVTATRDHLITDCVLDPGHCGWWGSKQNIVVSGVLLNHFVILLDGAGVMPQ
jgi:hypothetical protein